MTKTTDGMKIIDSMIGDDSQLREMCEQATVNARVAQLIYDARTQEGLSQKELAQMIGTTQSVISRLEDADYEGYSLSMLSRIAQALHREVKIDLVAVTPNIAESSFSRPSA
ncbi:MAG: multiprotein-bridging factor 1 family protein [Xenococcaceae cyanobacterium]